MAPRPGRVGGGPTASVPRNAADKPDNASESRWPRSWATCHKKVGRLRRVPRTGLSAELLATVSAPGPTEDPTAAPHRPTDGSARRAWSSVGYAALSTALLLALWQYASILIGAAVLPGPWATAQAALGSNPYFWSDVSITGVRILGAFGIALSAALVLGILIGSSSIAERILGPWVNIGASTPALVFIVVAYLAGGLSEISAMLGAAFVVAPSMTYVIWDGMRAMNPELSEMARAFGVRRRVLITRVVLPQTIPFVFTAARTGLSLTWRIMIFVELIGRSSGVGYRIQYWYNLFNMQQVLGVATSFCLLMLLVEFGVLRPIERHMFRWRRVEMR
jgi:NitT/TauT family transport system permease protein